jgi:hypothetical protein
VVFDLDSLYLFPSRRFKSAGAGVYDNTKRCRFMVPAKCPSGRRSNKRLAEYVRFPVLANYSYSGSALF